jgi:hypothetical protein
MFGAECELLVLVPRRDTRDGVIRIRLRGSVFICQPMHSRQKLHAVRSLNAFDQGRNSLQPALGGIGREKPCGLVARSGKKLNRRSAAAIAIASYEVSFDPLQDVMKILGVERIYP